MLSPAYVGTRLRDLYRVHGPRTATRLLWWRARRLLPGASWEPWLDDLVPRTGHTALDIGANVGQWSLRLARGYERVIAIEAEPRNAETLRRRAPANVDVIQCAASLRTGFAELQVYEDRQLCSLNGRHEGSDGASKWGTAKPVIVPTIPLLWLKVEHLDFVKVDVEGAEYDVIRGMQSLLTKHRPVILIEIHSYRDQGRLSHLLRTFGYEPTILHHPYYRPDNPRYEEYTWLYAKPTA